MRDVVAAAAAAGVPAPARAMVAGARASTPDARALLAAGDAVDALVRAGVAPYLDFLPSPASLLGRRRRGAHDGAVVKRDVFAASDVPAAGVGSCG